MPKIYTQNASRRTWRHPRAAVALVLGTFTVSLLLPTPLIASSWNPTLLVNTEAFQIVHEGDSAAGTDVELRFGDTLNERIYWDRANAEFRFTDDIRADGNITASGGLTVNAASRIKAGLQVAGTLTGSVLHVMSGANSYVLGNLGIGTTAPETKLEVVGAISGSSLQVTGSITMSGTVFNTLPLGTVEGRLTLTSGTPVTTADVTGATTIYFAPYKGNRIYLYDGTRWKLYSFSELSLALGTLTSDLPYDVFIYDNAGTLTLESLAWTNGTTRATALVKQNGVLSKTGVLTRRYLGTFYTTATTTTEDSATKRFLWNYYNRQTRKLKKIESTATWTYGTAALRSLNNSTANRVATITGWAEVPVFLNAQILVAHTDANAYGFIGIDVDGTSTNDADMIEIAVLPAAGHYQKSFANLLYYPSVGYHFFQLMEYTSAATATFYGTSGVLRLNGAIGHTEG